MTAVKKQPPRPRQQPANIDGLPRVALELPDGRYLLSYARIKAKPDA